MQRSGRQTDTDTDTDTDTSTCNFQICSSSGENTKHSLSGFSLIDCSWVSRPHHVYILHKNLMISSQVVHGVFETWI